MTHGKGEGLDKLGLRAGLTPQWSHRGKCDPSWSPLGLPMRGEENMNQKGWSTSSMKTTCSQGKAKLEGPGKQKDGPRERPNGRMDRWTQLTFVGEPRHVSTKHLEHPQTTQNHPTGTTTNAHGTWTKGGGYGHALKARRQ